MDQHQQGPPADQPAPARPPGSLRVARLFGTPVFLSRSWLLFATVVTFVYGRDATIAHPELPTALGYVLGAGFVVSLVGSVLLHELGHALVGRRLGLGVRGITLDLLGGYTELDRDVPVPRTEALVSAAGPAVSLLVGVATGAIAFVAPDDSIGAYFVARLAFSNVVLAVFNALPGLPLDGGRVLEAVVWSRTGDPNRGRVVAGQGGQV